MNRTRLVLVAIAAVVFLDAAPGMSAEETWTQRILEQVQQGRRQSGAEPLERRVEIDAAALAYAMRVAAQPHARRLAQQDPIDKDLNRNGVSSFRQARLHLDMGRGYTDPAGSFTRSWTRYMSSWKSALDSQFDAVGLAAVTAVDDWVILVAILVDDIKTPTDLQAVERQTFDQINAVRRAHDLTPLTYDERLADVARAYSQQMAQRDFFSHTGLDGSNAADRIERKGLRFRAIAENLHSNQGYDDPATIAVSGWMDSKGHRKNILDPTLTHTGIGVALAEDGRTVFTQLFMLPAP